MLLSHEGYEGVKFPIVTKHRLTWVQIPWSMSSYDSTAIARLVQENGGPSLESARAIGYYSYSPLAKRRHIGYFRPPCHRWNKDHL